MDGGISFVSWRGEEDLVWERERLGGYISNFVAGKKDGRRIAEEMEFGGRKVRQSQCDGGGGDRRPKILGGSEGRSAGGGGRFHANV